MGPIPLYESQRISIFLFHYLLTRLVASWLEGGGHMKPVSHVEKAGYVRLEITFTSLANCTLYHAVHTSGRGRSLVV